MTASAGVIQWSECLLPKQDVGSSNLLTRSKFSFKIAIDASKRSSCLGVSLKRATTRSSAPGYDYFSLPSYLKETLTFAR
jgi:hypothetical protein